MVSEVKDILEMTGFDKLLQHVPTLEDAEKEIMERNGEASGPVTKYLERNARWYPEEIALVELNPTQQDGRRITWKESDLIESSRFQPYRREITWRVFDEKANRFANMLIERGIKKGDKVAILLYNCLEWLPIYFGVLKAGAIAVPFNYLFTFCKIRFAYGCLHCIKRIFWFNDTRACKKCSLKHSIRMITQSKIKSYIGCINYTKTNFIKC